MAYQPITVNLRSESGANKSYTSPRTSRSTKVATLFFKLQGSPEPVAETSRVLQQIVQRHSNTPFEFATTDEKAVNLWENRKYALTSTFASHHPGMRCWTKDVCVPVFKLAQLVYETQEDLTNPELT
ncbi:hypothetical protein J3R82DRAFT_5260 [Butyriboletus roseoflavus]|nr:hypothetical protein J3R82DRAFT_5260 [Butyriboletus roseoflavus]